MCTPSTNIRRNLESLVKDTNVPKIRFHDLCHTYTILILMKDVNEEVISERIEYSNLKITLDTYMLSTM